VITKFFLAFGDGITCETEKVANEGNAIMSDGKGEESGDVATITFVETLEQQAASRVVGSKIVLNGLATTHGVSVIPNGESGRITKSSDC